MKKKLLFYFFVVAYSLNINSQSLSINALSTNLCINSKAYASVTSTAAGATSYSWTISSFSCSGTQTPSPNGLSTFITYPCCGLYTVSCSAMNGTTFISNASIAVSVSCNNASAVNITSASNGTICSTNIATLSGSGNTTYTWIPGNLSGANITVSPTSNTCYTLLANNASGCFNMSASYCMSVIPTYSMSISGNTAVCAGNSTTLNLSGGPSFVTFPGNINSNNPILTPSVTTGYTLWCPSNTYACPVSSVVPIIVNPVPIINVTNSTNTLNIICSGNSATLVASGAVSYTWSNGSTGPSIIVNPTANTCYSVVGNNVNGCNNLASYCFSVLPLPNVYVNGRGNLCHGSSFTFTASGANSYTWNTIPLVNTSTYNVLPLSTTIYSITGTGSNGCTRSDTAVVHVTTLCATVWPGDANRDGVVSTLDVLELGLAALNTGAARSSTSNAWAAQYATAWSGTVSTGWNKAHADCNGDGVVNLNDAVAITTNFALTHPFKPNSTSANPDIKIVATNSVAYEGIWNKADIILGDATNSISQLYGLVFDINYDQSKLQTDSVKINYTPSFLNANITNIDFGKPIFTSGKLYCASVRTDHSNVNGNGKIAEFWYKVKPGLPTNSSILISASNVQKVNATGTFNPLNVDAGIIVNISNNLTGLPNEDNMMNTKVWMYPNPSSKQITLQTRLGGVVAYSVSDIIGRELLKGDFNSSKQVDVSTLENGNYIVRFTSDKQSVTKKLIIYN